MADMSPQETLLPLLSGFMQGQMVYVAAKLGLADQLKDGPRSAEDLARATQTHAPSLYRLLRALASLGVFTEDGEGRFSLTPVGQGLRGDTPGSQRALAIMMGEEHYFTWGHLLDSIRTGHIAFDGLYGEPFFNFLSKHPDKAAIFDEAMVGIHGRETAAMLDGYDFSDLGVLADVGGGNGSLLMAVLKRYPAMRGILYDLPGVTERARPKLAAAGVGDRCRIIAGDFFKEAPPGADAYIMRHIIHDWDEPKCLQILRNIHRVMPAAGRLLVVETVIPRGNDPFFGKLLDLTMLLIPGGRERTEAEYHRLFEKAGFELTRIFPTATEISVIEGKKSRG